MTKLEPWWGSTNVGKAHYFSTVVPSRKGSVASCGESFNLVERERPWTRFRPNGVAWPKCKACEAALQSSVAKEPK